jgi:putative nucleotidyltransferase with HDIG domain
MQPMREIAPIRIDKDFEMPSVPLVLMKILQILDDNTSSALELERLILHDPSLSARILKLANSAFYCFPNQVKTISHAIVLLGLNLVKSLAIGVNIFDSFTRGMHKEAALINKLWMHSVGVGQLTQVVWGRRSNRKESEFAFLCGLLHDLGKVVFFKNDPVHYAEIFATEKGEEDTDIRAYEVDYYGMDHAALGAELAKRWGLPPQLVKVLQKHHAVLSSDDALIAAVALSDILAKQTAIGYDGDNKVTSDVDALQAHLKMSAVEYESLIGSAAAKRKEVEAFFLLAPGRK